jgi:hypothetical protein
MTTMSTTPDFPLPNPNEPASVESHRQKVFDTFESLFTLIDTALQASIPKARQVFSLLEGPIDLTLHAGLTRYLCRQTLAENNIDSQDEEIAGYEIQKIPNCGLCINRGLTQIRILKASTDGVPKASSEARIRFYQSNQSLLNFSENDSANSAPANLAGLVVLWELDEQKNYAGIQIACPRTTLRDGTVDCFWISTWTNAESAEETPEVRVDRTDPDLDGIQPITERRTGSR